MYKIAGRINPQIWYNMKILVRLPEMMNLNADQVDYYDLRDRWLSDKNSSQCVIQTRKCFHTTHSLLLKREMAYHG